MKFKPGDILIGNSFKYWLVCLPTDENYILFYLSTTSKDFQDIFHFPVFFVENGLHLTLASDILRLI